MSVLLGAEEAEGDESAGNVNDNRNKGAKERGTIKAKAHVWKRVRETLEQCL